MYPVTWKCPTAENPHRVCSDSEYKGPYEPKYFSNETHLDSFTVRYELYGPRRDLKDLQASVYFFTGCIGSLFFSFIADSFGRRITTLLSYVIMACSLAFGAIFLNFPSYFLALSAVGFAVAGYTNITFVLIAEPSSEAYFFESNLSLIFPGDDFRKLISIVILVVWAIGEATCVLAAYYITDAHLFLLLCMAIPMLLTSALFYWVYESPK
jgi:MFS family permease